MLLSQDLGLTSFQYGNQPSLGIDYTRAAMFIRIPPYHERSSDSAGKSQPKSIWEGIPSTKLDPVPVSRRGYGPTAEGSEMGWVIDDDDDEDDE